jgi:hypothetical protein
MFETTPSQPDSQAPTVEREAVQLSRGKYETRTPEGEAIIKKDSDDGLLISLTTPIQAELLAGRAATVKGPDGVETSVLEVGVTGLSEGGHDGIMLTKMQFDAPTIYSLIKKAVESGIIGQQPSVESNWAPGGKMEQMTNFAISLAQRSS